MLIYCRWCGRALELRQGAYFVRENVVVHPLCDSEAALLPRAEVRRRLFGGEPRR